MIFQIYLQVCRELVMWQNCRQWHSGPYKPPIISKVRYITKISWTIRLLGDSPKLSLLKYIIHCKVNFWTSWKDNNLSSRYVARNSRIQGKWGEEEATSITKFELRRNENFYMDIVTTENEFLVSINGKHVCAFGYRLPVSKITTVMVHGTVDVEDVQYKKLEIYPQVGPQNTPYTIPTGDGQDKDTVQQLVMIALFLKCPGGDLFYVGSGFEKPPPLSFILWVVFKCLRNIVLHCW